MSTSFTLPEDLKLLGGAKPAADAAGRTARYISCKNLHKVFMVVYIDQGNAATIALTPNQATAVAGTATKATPAVRIWSNLDIAANGDVLTRRTDAASYTTDAGVKEKIVVFEIDPASLDQANGFDCVALLTGASNAANITSIVYYGVQRYAGSGASSASVIVD